MMNRCVLFLFVLMTCASTVFAVSYSCDENLTVCTLHIQDTTDFNNLSSYMEKTCSCEGSGAIPNNFYPSVVSIDADLEYSSETQNESCSNNFQSIFNFKGTILGNNHTISGICLKDEAGTYGDLALFMNTEPNIRFEDLHFENIYVEGLANQNISLLVSSLSTGVETDIPSPVSGIGVAFKNLSFKNITLNVSSNSFFNTEYNGMGLLIGSYTNADSLRIEKVTTENVILNSKFVSKVGGLVGFLVLNETNVTENQVQALNNDLDITIAQDLSNVSNDANLKAFFAGGIFGTIGETEKSPTVTASQIVITNNTIQLKHSFAGDAMMLSFSGIVIRTGGVSGFTNYPLNISNTNVSGSYSYNSGLTTVETPMKIPPEIVVGGLIGEHTDTLKVQNSYFKGFIDVENLYIENVIAGGIVGKANKALFIDNSYAVSDADTLISVSYNAEAVGTYSHVYLGGIVGSASLQAKITNAFVKGLLAINDSRNPDDFYLYYSMAGILGFGSGLDSLNISNTYFIGTGISATIATQALFNISETKLDECVYRIYNHYTLDAAGNINSFFNTTIDIFPNLDTASLFLGNSVQEIATPQVAATLNSQRGNITPNFIYLPTTENGLPQLLTIPTPMDLQSTYSVSFMKNQSPLAVGFTDGEGKLVYDSIGGALDYNSLPNKYTFTEDSLRFDIYSTYVGNTEEVWTGDTAKIYNNNVAYFNETFYTPTFSFNYTDVSGALQNLEDKPITYWWNGNNFSLFENDTLPEIIYEEQIAEKTSYLRSNTWALARENSTAECTTSDCILLEARPYMIDKNMELPLTLTKTFDTWALDIQTSENSGIKLSTTIMDEPFTKEVESSLVMPRVSYLILDEVSFDTAVVIGNDTLVILALAGDTIYLNETIGRLEIITKTSYSITYDKSSVQGTIFRTSEMPDSYYYRQKKVAFPLLLNEFSCPINLELENLELGFLEQTKDSNFVWQPLYSEGDVNFLLNSETCVSKSHIIDVEMDSLVQLSITHFGDTLDLIQNQLFLPVLENLPLILKTNSLKEKTVARIFYNGELFDENDTLYVSENGVLKIILESVSDTFSIAKANVNFSGNAARISVLPEQKNNLGDLKLSVSLYQNKTLILDTLLASAIESLKYYTLDIYPLASGTYNASVSLMNEADSAVIEELSFSVDSLFNRNLKKEAWHMVSLSGIDSSFVLDSSKMTIYYWDEENPIGEYFQYKQIKNLKNADRYKGYWLFMEDSIAMPFTKNPLKAASDSLTFQLKNKFSGWNLIANPYSWNLYVGSSEKFLDPENAENPFWSYDAEKNEYIPVDTLKAYSGVFVFTKESEDYKISAKPVFNDSSKNEVSVLKKAAAKESFALRLKLQSKDEEDSWNVIGFGSKNISLEKPPQGFSENLSLGIISGNQILSKSISSSEQNLSWNLNLNSLKAQKATFRVEGLENLALGNKQILLEIDGKTYELKNDATIPLDFKTQQKKANIRIVEQIPQFAKFNVENLRYVLEAKKLNVSFTINENISENVRISITDIQGNIISSVSKSASAGENKFALETPRNSGIYFMQIQIGNFSERLRFKMK